MPLKKHFFGDFIGDFSFQFVLRGHGETTVPRHVAVWRPTRSAVPTTKACVFVRRDGEEDFVTLTLTNVSTPLYTIVLKIQSARI